MLSKSSVGAILPPRSLCSVWGKNLLLVVVGGQEPDDGDEDVDRAHDRVCGLLVPVHCLLHLVGEIIEQVQNTWIPTEDEVRERVREGAREDVNYTKASHYKKIKEEIKEIFWMVIVGLAIQN